MPPANAPKSPSNDSSGAAPNERQAQPRGEAASYFNQEQSFESTPLQGQSGTSDRIAPQGHAAPGRNPYGYTENAGEAGETYAGTAPPISYQQTLPGSAPVPAAPVEGHHAPAAPLGGITGPIEPEHGGRLPPGAHEGANPAQSHPSAPYAGPKIKLGKRGTMRGFVALARRKPHVRDDTPARLELLRRADKFFNEGFIGKYGRLNKEKTALFRQEIDRIEAKIGQL